MDDGADVISVLHGERPEQLSEVYGGTEETTTGVIRLKALEAEGKLGFPIIAVNEANTKHFFDNRYGTGQSTLDGVIRATNVLIAGLRVVVIGYGWCGKGVAMRAKGHGAHVIVCEVDPLRALEAVMDGFDVMPGVEAAREGDVFISVTGNRDAIAGEMFDVMKSGAIVCNSGHFDVEINKGDLDDRTESTFEARPLVEGHVLKDGREIFLLAEGRLVNLATAEGHPAAVMDMSFANQALAAEYMAKNHESWRPRSTWSRCEIDQEIARLKLASKGIEIDTPDRDPVEVPGQLGPGHLDAGATGGPWLNFPPRAGAEEAALYPSDDPGGGPAARGCGPSPMRCRSRWCRCSTGR